MRPLLDPSLFQSSCLIHGQWVQSASGSTIAVQNPATSETLAHIPSLSQEEVGHAITAAAQAFDLWRGVAPKERAALLRKWYDLVLANAQDLASLIVQEQGKPVSEALGEVDYAASYLEFYAEEAKRIQGEVLTAPFPDSKVFIEKQPVGVVGIITPWNFPIAMMARKMAPALAAGCSCVVKPDERTPLSAFAFLELGCRAGLPNGVVNAVTGVPRSIGEVFTRDPRIRKLSFTGSTRVGKWLLQESAATVKRVTMELGGNAPFIVFEDADLPSAVQGLITAKFRNTGQTCVCANRIFVHSAVAEPFTALLKAAVQSLRVGDGFESCDVGPLIDREALSKTERLVEDALRQGGVLCCGGTRHSSGGLFYTPTVLSNIRPEMAVFSEEQFAPIAAIVTFDTEQEVLALANDTTAGLASYFFTKDLGKVWRVSSALDFGMVGINTGSISSAGVPFGGIKESGMGREGAHQGLEEYLNLKYIKLDY